VVKKKSLVKKVTLVLWKLVHYIVTIRFILLSTQTQYYSYSQVSKYFLEHCSFFSTTTTTTTTKVQVIDWIVVWSSDDVRSRWRTVSSAKILVTSGVWVVCFGTIKTPVEFHSSRITLDSLSQTSWSRWGEKLLRHYHDVSGPHTWVPVGL